MSAASIMFVITAYVVGQQPLHELTQCSLVSRFDNEVKVIWHQASDAPKDLNGPRTRSGGLNGLNDGNDFFVLGKRFEHTTARRYNGKVACLFFFPFKALKDVRPDTNRRALFFDTFP